MDDDECCLTRGGHFESERASLAMIVAGNMQLFFVVCIAAVFKFGNPSRIFGKSRLLCWDLPDRGLRARPTAPATRPLSSTSRDDELVKTMGMTLVNITMPTTADGKSVDWEECVHAYREKERKT